MKTHAVCLPFDSFGSAGASEGAQLLFDGLREIIEEAEEETRPCRTDCYRQKVEMTELSFSTEASLSRWREIARKAIEPIWNKEDFLLWLAGNHLGVAPVYDALGPDDLVIQFDAHLDIYNLRVHATTPNHGNFILSLSPNRPEIINLGHRDLFLNTESVQGHFTATFSAQEIHSDHKEVLKQVEKLCKKKRRIVMDLDVDVFDPAYFPAVGYPLPFGLTAAQFLDCVSWLWSKRVCGFCISEFIPAKDQSELSQGTLVWLLEWLLLKIHEKNRSE